jgi:hypothetical protein
MDVSGSASYYIDKKNKNKGSRMGYTKKKKNSNLSLVDTPSFSIVKMVSPMSAGIPSSPGSSL